MLMILCIFLAAIAGSIIVEGFEYQGLLCLMIAMIFSFAQLSKTISRSDGR
jgi:hypothetical protein